MEDKKLAREVRKGRYVRVQNLLSQGADVNAKGADEFSLRRSAYCCCNCS